MFGQERKLGNGWCYGTLPVMVALVLGVGPQAASAGAITVNTNSDLSMDNGACTLREAAAAASSNTASGAMGGECAAGEPANPDSISVAASVVGQTISIGSVIDELTGGGPVAIDACSSQASPTQPCVGLRPSSNLIRALDVTSPDVTIKGFAISNANVGINGLAGASNLTVRNHWFGLTIAGVLEASSVGRGVVVVGNNAVIGGSGAGDRNVFAGTGGPGSVGLQIFTGEGTQVIGNLFGVEEDGTTAAGPNTNIILESNGTEGPNTTVIGGDTAAEENVISNASGDGIQVLNAVDNEDNRFLRNRGSGNGDLFIDICGGGAGNPCGAQEGVLAPTITASGANSAGGTAAPNATVRLYSKTVSSPGEVEGFLGQAIADGAGQWAVTHNASLPNGKLVTANQTTTTNNSSELAAAVATTPPVIVTPPAITPVTTTPASTATGLRAAALKKCKKKPKGPRRKKCIKKAKKLPV